MTIDKILVSENEEVREEDSYLLDPNGTIIKTKEKLKIPDNILGRVVEKNSVLRTGLAVSGSHYQPGHVTYGFWRIHNISGNIIKLNSGRKIAQIIFEELKEVPDKTYSQNSDAYFNDEVHYRGYGKYTDEYKILRNSKQFGMILRIKKHRYMLMY